VEAGRCEDGRAATIVRAEGEDNDFQHFFHQPDYIDE